MLRYGTSVGLSMDELSRITNPDVILGLSTAVVANEVEE
jgi:hypothetical protein